MIKNLICIGCPLGCPLTAEMQDGKVLSVRGNTCPRGKKYAEKELTNPERTVTSSVKVVDGEMVLNVEGTDNTIKAGESFIIPSGARHSVRADHRFKMLLTMIRG